MKPMQKVSFMWIFISFTLDGVCGLNVNLQQHLQLCALLHAFCGYTIYLQLLLHLYGWNTSIPCPPRLYSYNTAMLSLMASLTFFYNPKWPEFVEARADYCSQECAKEFLGRWAHAGEMEKEGGQTRANLAPLSPLGQPRLFSRNTEQKWVKWKIKVRIRLSVLITHLAICAALKPKISRRNCGKVSSSTP